MKINKLRVPATALLLAAMAPWALARTNPAQVPTRNAGRVQSAVGVPYITNRTHKVGNIAFTVTNWGFIGSQSRGVTDPCTRRPAESFEFPRGTDIEYLFQGALWLGAIKGRDTLVSVGADGWTTNNEMFPLPFDDGGDIIERTNRGILRAPPNSPCPDITFSEDAVSEQDFVAVYYDTVTNTQFVGRDVVDGRPHVPIGLQVTQESYSWSFDYAKDFILMDFQIKNISGQRVDDMYMGLYMDHDVAHTSVGQGYNDDITGFTETVPSNAGEDFPDTVNMAWIADNDGDPEGTRFGPRSATGVTGVRVVRAPVEDLNFSFNWWVSNTTASQDWGPNKRNTKVRYVSGNRGTPEGDVAKYLTMSNGEFDYVQVESAIDHQADGWFPPVQGGLATDLADGFDTRYLLSFGPFDVAPDSTLPLTIAIVAGADFHTEPRNFQQFFDPFAPQTYLERLDLTSFARNAQWAGWVYDTPGFDTNDDGFAGNYRIINGDTIYYSGDGIPDFQGPPPPPVPKVRFKTVERKIIMQWNGQETETTRDIFSNLPDFEGYRVYMGRTGVLANFALLAQRDNINYIRHRYKSDAFRWVIEDPPFTLDSLQTLYNTLIDTAYWPNTPFSPDSFPVADTNLALREILVDDIDPSKLDTNYYYFSDFNSNEQADDVGLAIQDSLTGAVTGVIRKRFPNALPTDSIVTYGNEVVEWPYYEYEYAIDGLSLAEPVYLAVTTFDFGNPQAGLAPLESSPLSTSEEVWPLNSAEVVKTNRPTPGVYPNPYRVVDDYGAQGWEDPRGTGGDPERERKVTFTNVPDTCTISIWTLDGDLVRRLDHAEDPGNSQATVVVWDLITRNTQSVKTGLYIYTVESRFGTDIGKLVIIK